MAHLCFTSALSRVSRFSCAASCAGLSTLMGVCATCACLGDEAPLRGLPARLPGLTSPRPSAACRSLISRSCSETLASSSRAACSVEVSRSCVAGVRGGEG